MKDQKQGIYTSTISAEEEKVLDTVQAQTGKMATGGQETPRPGLEGNLVDVSPLYGDDIQLRSRRIPRARRFARKEKVDSEITLQHNYYNPISAAVVQDMTTTSDAEITSLKKKFSTTQKQIEDCSQLKTIPHSPSQPIHP